MLTDIKKIKCPICGHKYISKEALYSHIENEHGEMIDDGKPVDQYYYDLIHGNSIHRCVICKKPTVWNVRTHKYQRLCGRPDCAKKVRAIFHQRMMKKYQTDNLAADPEHQKKMLQGRRISGTYEWASGGTSDYVGSYELDFLKMCDLVLDMKSNDIVSPSPHTYKYIYEGKTHFYIPDFYIPDLFLEIEIKDGGDNPNMHHKIQDVDKKKEMLKDAVLKKQQSYNYIKVVNKDYRKFIELYKTLSLNEEDVPKSKIKIVD